MVTLTLCLLGFLATLSIALVTRRSCGVTWSELARTRCYEVVPLRGLLWTLLALAWVVFVADVVVFGMKLLALVFGDQRSARLVLVVVVSGLLVWPLLLLRRFVQRRLIDLPKIDPPAATIANANFRAGIPHDDFSCLGSERFPNHVAPQRHADQKVRWALLLTAGFLVVLLFALYNQHSDQTKRGSPSAPVLAVAPKAAALVADVGLFVLIVGATLLGALAYDNRDYTFIPFRAALVLELLLGLVVLLGALLVQAHPPGLFLAIGAVIVACAVRAGADVRRSWRYDRMKKVYNPIAEILRDKAPYLAQLPQEQGYRLPALSVDALHRRISQGCKNVEERGLFVRRHFARFLDLLEVDYQDCAMVMLRYLTWRRYVTLGPGAGTYDYLRYPEVPWWDLERFPLAAKAGYVEWTDPLGLGSEYDVVVTCGSCGGSGRVRRTVTETQNNQTVTREVEETCGGCGGCGRLKHQQILNTQWQRLLPLVTHPDMRVPELVEDAEDVTYVHVAFVEERQPVPLEAKATVPRGPTLDRMLQTVREVATLHEEHAKTVEKLHDGFLYRADFQVCGYRTIRIGFERLGGQVGWFFGKRPEFYFPRLPLSWSAVGTCVFLPPLAAALLLGVGALALTLFNSV